VWYIHTCIMVYSVAFYVGTCKDAMFKLCCFLISKVYFTVAPLLVGFFFFLSLCKDLLLRI